MPNNKIVSLKVDRDTCIGAGPCIAAAGSVFEFDAEQKAVIKKKGGALTSDNTPKSELADEAITDDVLMAAAQSCPVRAIFLYGENGEQLFP